MFVAAVVVAALSSQHRATAQVSSASDDPLRHGHALLIGNSHYQAWPQLVDVPLQLDELAGGLKIHFDTVEVVRDLETDPLRQKINMFLRSYGMTGTHVCSFIMRVMATPSQSWHIMKCGDI